MKVDVFSRLVILLAAAFLSQLAFPQPAPISEKEYKFLMALNVFGSPGVPRSKFLAAKGQGCVDKEGNLVMPNEERVIDGFELTCMVKSKPENSEGGAYLWFPSRFAQYCKDFSSFDECAATQAKKDN